MTLAPELATPSQLAALVALGPRLSAGHSKATFAQARTGFAAGVTQVTHLFNAMPPLGHREPGLAGAALTTPGGPESTGGGPAGRLPSCASTLLR